MLVTGIRAAPAPYRRPRGRWRHDSPARQRHGNTASLPLSVVSHDHAGLHSDRGAKPFRIVEVTVARTSANETANQGSGAIGHRDSRSGERCVAIQSSRGKGSARRDDDKNDRVNEQRPSAEMAPCGPLPEAERCHDSDQGQQSAPRDVACENICRSLTDVLFVWACRECL
jgi:hypothetical protein